MATAIGTISAGEPTPAEQRVVLDRIDWETFQRLAWADEGRAARMAYDRGVLEIMSPGPTHEFDANLLGRLIDVVTEELEIPCAGYGSTTWDRPELEKAIEADRCYYLTAEKTAAGGRRSNRSHAYPPPDLAVEVEITDSAIDKLAIYAALGVPEVWRFDGEVLRVLGLQEDGNYAERPDSRFLPIRPAEVVRWVAEVEALDQTAWARRLRAWVRAELIPRHQEGRA